jgi:hypothetical protein
MVTRTRGGQKPTAEVTNDLTCVLHVRVSGEVLDLVQHRAAKAGVRPTTWVRTELRKILGLNDGK